jgi:hypothetical protein
MPLVDHEPAWQVGAWTIEEAGRDVGLGGARGAPGADVVAEAARERVCGRVVAGRATPTTASGALVRPFAAKGRRGRRRALARGCGRAEPGLDGGGPGGNVAGCVIGGRSCAARSRQVFVPAQADQSVGVEREDALAVLAGRRACSKLDLAQSNRNRILGQIRQALPARPESKKAAINAGWASDPSDGVATVGTAP